MAGLTDKGLVIRTQPELVALIKATIQDAFREDGIEIDLDEGPEQQIIEAVAEKIAEPWEALQALYGAMQGRGRGVLANFYAAITGTLQRGATATRVPSCAVNLDAGVTLEAGAIASIDGNPDAQFALVATVMNGSGITADIDAVFKCLTTGPIAAPATKLSVIITPKAGWNSVTNTEAGVKGRPVADEVELAATRVIELAGRGRRTLAAIRAVVSKVPDVISAQVYDNVTSNVVDGRPPKSLEVVVWDGGGAIDGDIAQAIYDSAPEGIEVFSQSGPGTSSGSATDETGEQIDVAFTRATVLRTYLAVTVVNATCSAAQIKDAAAARGDLFLVGEVGSYDELIQALRDALPTTIGRITSLTIGTAPAPVSTLVTPSYAQLIRIALADVAVTGVA